MDTPQPQKTNKLVKIIIISCAIILIIFGLFKVYVAYNRSPRDLPVIVEPEPTEATSESSIQLSRNYIAMIPSKPAIIKISIYNMYSENINIKPFIICSELSSFKNESNIHEIAPNETSLFVMKISLDKSTLRDSKNLCMVRVKDQQNNILEEYDKELVIAVQ